MATRVPKQPSGTTTEFAQAGTPLRLTELDADLDSLFTNIDDSNIAAAANILGSKLASGTVTDTQLAANSVTSAKIVNANVTGVKLADLAVGTAKLADAAVTTVKVADAAITFAKLAAMGSGSGLDADKLDGLDSLAFVQGVMAGSYVGNNAPSRLISLARTPKIVFVFSAAFGTQEISALIYGVNSGLRLQIPTGRIELQATNDTAGLLGSTTANGFLTGTGTNLNTTGTTYFYVAL